MTREGEISTHPRYSDRATKSESSKSSLKGTSLVPTEFFGGLSPLSPNPAGELLQEVGWPQSRPSFLEAEWSANSDAHANHQP